MGLSVPAQVGALQVWEGRWRVIPYDVLPDWLKDNDYLLHGHRPPMPSFRACFKSIFRIHTETGNIWTHLLGDWGSPGAARCFHGAGAVPGPNACTAGWPSGGGRLACGPWGLLRVLSVPGASGLGSRTPAWSRARRL